MKARFEKLEANRLQVIVETEDHNEILLMQDFLKQQSDGSGMRFMIISSGGTETRRSFAVGSYEEKKPAPFTAADVMPGDW